MDTMKHEQIMQEAQKLVVRGKLDAAVDEYRRAVDQLPGDTNALNRLGDLLVRLERISEAVEVYQRMAEHFDRDGFFLKAIGIYKKVLRLAPNDLGVYEKLAELFAKQGLKPEARAQFEALARHYEHAGEAERAQEIYKRIEALRTADAARTTQALTQVLASSRTDRPLADDAEGSEANHGLSPSPPSPAHTRADPPAVRTPGPREADDQEAGGADVVPESLRGPESANRRPPYSPRTGQGKDPSGGTLQASPSITRRALEELVNALRIEVDRLADHNTETELDQMRVISESTVVVPGEGTFDLMKPLIGFKREIDLKLTEYYYRDNVFLMMKFRDSNRVLGEFIIQCLAGHGLRGVRADNPEWNITSNVYNPIAVLYCCKYGIALFDEPEQDQAYSPNVAFELGIMQVQNKECLILRHSALPKVPFDLIKDLYRPYSRDLDVRKIVDEWASRTAERRILDFSQR